LSEVFDDFKMPFTYAFTCVPSQVIAKCTHWLVAAVTPLG